MKAKAARRKVSKQARTLTILIGSPTAGQKVTAGTLIVSGIASETGGNPAEPNEIAEVTIECGGSTVDAELGPPPQPEKGVVGFSAAVNATYNGELRIKATAIDDMERSVATSVTVVVSGGVVLPILPGSPWTNYVQTQSITPQFFGEPRSLDDLVVIVRLAEANGGKVHAMGSTYSFSDCAMTPGYMVETRGLRKPIQTVQQALLGPMPAGFDVYHVEAGILIRELYQNLGALNCALETMGGTSGQTIAGAISTGTHGGDYRMGPLADSVLALHLVGAGGTQYWIEPATGAITDPGLLHQYVVPDIDVNNIFHDDDLFNACLVSLGCMGIVYAVVLRVRTPQYDLHETTVESTWTDFLGAAKTYLNDSSKRFLQVAIVPYRDSSNVNKCLVTTRQEKPATQPGTRPGFTPSDFLDAVCNLIHTASLDDYAAIITAIKDIWSQPISFNQKIVKTAQLLLSKTDGWVFLTENYWSLMKLLWPAAEFQGYSYSVMDTTYNSTPDAALPSYSIELFFPVDSANGQLGFVDFVNGALDAINGATSTFLLGYISLRFTGATRAYLGMQQWNQTCAVEISVLQGIGGEEDLLTQILNMGLKMGGLPHWGQLIDRGVQGSRTMYPKFAQWRNAYRRLSNNFATQTFQNALSVRWELTTP